MLRQRAPPPAARSPAHNTGLRYAEEGSRHARRSALPPQGSPVRRTVVPLKLAELKPHPQQGKLFPAVPEEQIRAIAASIKESGLDHPIEVVPDHSGYMIVAGHCRVEAARRLGWTEIDATIRYDLAEQGPLAAEFYMIKDNFLRRQLSPLQRAQCALSLKELAMQRQCDGQPLDRVAKAVIRQTQSTRDEIGDLLGISGREVSRLFRVLETPPEVQTVFDAGKLSLVLAERIAGLDDAKQQAWRRPSATARTPRPPRGRSSPRRRASRWR